VKQKVLNVSSGITVLQGGEDVNMKLEMESSNSWMKIFILASGVPIG